MEFKVVCVVLALFVACATAKPQKAPLLAADDPTALKNSYIVVMKEELSDDDIDGHKNLVRNLMHFHSNISKIKVEYNIGKGFRGYSILADDKTVDMIRTMSEVKYVERNLEVHTVAACEYQSNAEWGLHRTISEELEQGNEYYEYDADGDGVDAYIIDTGIYLEHNEFGGRAVWGYDAVDSPSPKNDPNGHGTHVAGTVIGNKYGLARKATAVAVRVLNAFGSGSFEQVIEGIDWVADQHSSAKKSVANMSLGGGKHQATNDAVNAAVAKGVHFAIAAGNSNANTCNYSPASAEDCVAVGSSDNTDSRSSFSNYGTCTDIFAPGSSIKSAYPSTPDNTATLSGTSMAAPHVCGVMAKILSETDDYDKPEDMADFLKETANKDMLSNPGTGSPNLLVYHPCSEADVHAN